MRSSLLPLPVAAVLLGVAATPSLAQSWLAGPLVDSPPPVGPNGPVYSMTTWNPFGSGTPDKARLVIGGAFTQVGGVAVTNAAMLDPATGQWSKLRNFQEPVREVHALAVFQDNLYFGTDSQVYSGQVLRQRTLASFADNVSSGFTGGGVLCFALHDSNLYAGGGYVDQTLGLNWLGIFDGTHWSPLAQQLGAGNGRKVYAMAEYNGELIAGGSFYQPYSGLSRWRETFWDGEGGWGNESVSALAVYQGELIVGDYTSASGSGQPLGIRAWNGSTWRSLGTTSFDAPIRCFAVYNNELYAGGEFVTADGNTVNHVARWNGSSWVPLAGGGGTDGPVYAMSVYEGELLVGGSFGAAGSTTVANLARFNGSTWSPFGGGTATSVLAFATYRGRNVAAGEFHQALPIGPVAHEILGWDGLGLSTFGSGMNNPVFALESFKYPGLTGDYELIAGGSFTAAGGTAASSIARWREDPIDALPPPAWQPMGAGFNGSVYAIKRHNSQTYAGGAFTFSSTAVNRIARWNETTQAWEALGTGMNGPVYALASFNGSLYVGGAFTTAGGITTGGFARWNGTSWSNVGGNFIGTIYSLEVHGGVLAIGGVFPGINSSPNLAWYNGTSYGTFSTGGTTGAVHALYSTGSRLYVGGTFSAAGNVPCQNLAYWDTSWHDVPGGTAGEVDDLALFGDAEIQVGGRFASVANASLPSPRWGRFSESGTAWLASNPVSRTVLAGSAATFVSQAASGYQPTYRWLKNGVPLADGATGLGSIIDGATTSALSIDRANAWDEGAYRLVAGSVAGTDTSAAATLSVTNVVGLPPTDAPAGTVSIRLLPNPVRGAGTLVFRLPTPAHVRARIYDVAGRERRAFDLGVRSAGPQNAGWDATDGSGRALAAGLYFAVLEADGRRLGGTRVVVVR